MSKEEKTFGRDFVQEFGLWPVEHLKFFNFNFNVKVFSLNYSVYLYKYALLTNAKLKNQIRLMLWNTVECGRTEFLDGS